MFLFSIQGWGLKKACSAVTALDSSLESPNLAFVADSARVGFGSACACSGAYDFSLKPLAHDSAGEKLCSLNYSWNDRVMICHDLG